MGLHVTVTDGTNAGWKPSLKQTSGEWECPRCQTLNKTYWRRCMTDGCNAKRPAA